MEQQKGLTGSTLKIIAMVTMLIDHIGASILERGVMPKVADGSVMDAGVEAMKVYNRWKVVDMACRGIGRIAFPIPATGKNISADCFCSALSQKSHLTLQYLKAGMIFRVRMYFLRCGSHFLS